MPSEPRRPQVVWSREKGRLFASDQPLWMPTDFAVGPCPPESATGQMEEMPRPRDGHVWPLYDGALGSIRLLHASGERLLPLTAIWNVGTAVPGDFAGGERLVRLSDIACWARKQLQENLSERFCSSLPLSRQTSLSLSLSG